MSIKNLPRHKRPREKLIELGVSNLTDQELLALILRSGTSKSNVLKIATDVSKKIDLYQVADLTVENVRHKTGLGIVHASSLLAAIELGNRVRDDHHVSLTHPEQILQVINYLVPKKQEHFVCIYVNARYNFLKKETISIGTVDTSLAHPREIFRPAIEIGASYVIVAHNHPSGDPEPSQADILLTARIVEVGEVIGIQVLDHIIIGSQGWVSLKKREIL